MTKNDDAERLAELAKEGRPILELCVRNARKIDKQQPLGELDNYLIERACAAYARIFVLDAGMKRVGTFSPAGEALYIEACAERDAMLKALRIEDPYRLPPNKLA